jgi:hypothetical protein
LFILGILDWEEAEPKLTRRLVEDIARRMACVGKLPKVLNAEGKRPAGRFRALRPAHFQPAFPSFHWHPIRQLYFNLS